MLPQQEPLESVAMLLGVPNSLKQPLPTAIHFILVDRSGAAKIYKIALEYERYDLHPNPTASMLPQQEPLESVMMLPEVLNSLKYPLPAIIHFILVDRPRAGEDFKPFLGLHILFLKVRGLRGHPKSLGYTTEKASRRPLDEAPISFGFDRAGKACSYIAWSNAANLANGR